MRHVVIHGIVDGSILRLRSQGEQATVAEEGRCGHRDGGLLKDGLYVNVLRQGDGKGIFCHLIGHVLAVHHQHDQFLAVIGQQGEGEGAAVGIAYRFVAFMDRFAIIERLLVLIVQTRTTKADGAITIRAPRDIGINEVVVHLDAAVVRQTTERVAAGISLIGDVGFVHVSVDAGGLIDIAAGIGREGQVHRLVPGHIGRGSTHVVVGALATLNRGTVVGGSTTTV